MKRVHLLLMCCFVLICSSCTPTKSKRVTEENRDRILSEISTTKDLTDEERQLIAAYLMRTGVAEVFRGGKPGLPVGKTINEILDEQRKWVAQEKQEEDRQKQLAAAVVAKQAEMRSIVGVALYSLVAKQGFAFDGAEVGYAYENRSTKDIRAFEGRIEFKDILGNELADVSLKVLNPIKAGEKASVSANLWFEAYGGLRGKRFDDVKIEWRPTKILFSDGTLAEVGSQQ
jgi:hypothetical protein